MYAPPAPPPPAAVAPLIWVAQPTADEIDRAEAIVSDALRAPASAKAGAHGSMACLVKPDGRLEACRIVPQPDDTPGFGAATLQLQDLYQLDGRSRPADGMVLVRVVFPRRFDEAPRVLSRATPEEVASANPLGEVGSLRVLCRVTVEGSVRACAAEKGDLYGADNPRLQAAAVSLAERIKMQPARVDGEPVPSYDAFNFNFNFKGGHQITAPQWAEKPNPGEMIDAYPLRAREQGEAGSAKIRCKVTSTGVLVGCEVVEESPQGFGFGAAAMMLSSRFVMKPRMIDGAPVDGGTVIIPLLWERSLPWSSDPGRTIRIYPWAPWLEAPDAAAVAGAYPRAEAQRGIAGRTTLRCGLSKEGRTQACAVVEEAPEAHGFSGAALKLAKSFRSDMAGVTPAKREEMRVSLVFDFSPRALTPPTDRFVRSMDWIRGPDPKAVRQAYPAEALRAGERSRLGYAECRIGPDGALQDCRPAPGHPDELGFGAAAAKVAGGMRANRWTRDGEAAVGQKVTAPIRMVYGADTDTPQPAAKPAS